MKLFEIYKPDDLATYANQWVDNADAGESVSLYDWIFVSEMPLSILVTKKDIHGKTHSLKEWVEWFKEENDMSREEMGSAYWEHLMDEEFDHPIVITMSDQSGDSWDIWDGWHRSAASLATDRKSIPAVIGYYKG